ncbi:MAG: DUF2116 family Zn-ribbon domain-containing protein [archaeon]|nr:DUF2116 family Zn-ribbon domain-containing protein [archaeon]
MTEEDFKVKIPQHRHCRKCGKAFVGEGYFCSDECHDTEGAEAKKKLRKYLVVVVILWAVTIGAVIVTGI